MIGKSRCLTEKEKIRSIKNLYDYSITFNETNVRIKGKKEILKQGELK